MRVIDLALKDLSQLVRDWKSAAFLLVMPIVFTLMFGLVFADAGGQEDPRLPVGFLDRDGGSLLSAGLLDLLDASEVVRPEVLAADEADDVEKKVREGELVAAVIVPAGYGERMLAGDLDSLTVVVDLASAAGSTVQGEIRAVAARLAGAVQAAQLGARAYAAQVDLDGAARQRFLEEAVDGAIDAWKDPPLTVAVTQSRAIAGEEEEATAAPSGYAQTSPGMMVQFAMAGLIGASEILLLERKSRALQRLLTTAISRVEIILGHFLAMFVIVLLQLVLLTTFGQLVLGVGYAQQPLATLLVMVSLALWTASLGLLIGVLAKTEEQVIIFSLIPMLVLSGLGGAWMPLEFTSEAFQTVGHLTPTAWAMDGFKNIVIRGLGLESALLPVGIMLAYAVLFFGLAVWRFRFD
jgi:ABC-2 type transport system permease protein